MYRDVEISSNRNRSLDAYNISDFRIFNKIQSEIEEKLKIFEISFCSMSLSSGNQVDGLPLVVHNTSADAKPLGGAGVYRYFWV